MLYRTIRGIITVSRAEALQGARKRPIPVVFVGTKTTSELAQQWQSRLSELGFDSAIARLDVNNNEQGNELLQSWFKDVNTKIREMGMFPPVLIGHGEAAWRLCQKYVANEPLSGLVLISGPSSVDPQTLPSFEFEPRFPILAVSEAPRFLIEDEIDIIQEEEETTEKKNQQQEEMNQVLNWVQENF
ncbi:hypothetical protein BDA99DRAFT_516522 [Phascolomyces articulosus]|uniref:Alpha/beta hydrolase n=1 Tax=Phascolomyces articulosus TaxID=60185 RepID=A0AAD5K8S9_9FUNG|nr:hypothetical protein BDA99DRAFT_516522 [Phascolomyces articulosus]